MPLKFLLNQNISNVIVYCIMAGLKGPGGQLIRVSGLLDDVLHATIAGTTLRLSPHSTFNPN